MGPEELIDSFEVNVHQEKTIGSTWITRYRSQRWPVVLCKESQLPQAFVDTRRGEHERPAILLGLHKYVWVTYNRLDEYIPSIDYLGGTGEFVSEDVQPDDDETTRIEKFRHIAFKCDAPELCDDKYWHNYIVQKSAARKVEKQLSPRQKRRRSSTDDDTDDEIQMTTAWTKQNYSNSANRNTGYLPSPNSSPLSTQKKKATRSKTKPLVIELDDGAESESDQDTIFISQSSRENSSTDKPLTDINRKKLKRAEQSPKNEGSCEILLPGEDDTKITFRLQQQDLIDCDYLQNLQQKNPHTGDSIIDLSSNDGKSNPTNLTAKDFTFISDFLKTKDIGPPYLNPQEKKEKKKTLSPTDRTPKQKISWAEKLGLAFIAANKVQYESMQKVIYEKLQALYPLEPLSILIIAQVVSYMQMPENLYEEELAKWIIDHIVEYFWRLAAEHGGALQRLLEQNDDLRAAVYGRLAADGRLGKGGLEEED